MNTTLLLAQSIIKQDFMQNGQETNCLIDYDGNISTLYLLMQSELELFC